MVNIDQKNKNVDCIKIQIALKCRLHISLQIYLDICPTTAISIMLDCWYMRFERYVRFKRYLRIERYLKFKMYMGT